MLLIDQNLPLALTAALTPFFPGTVHVKELGMECATDTALWSYALEKKLVIITKDSGLSSKINLGKN